MAQQEQNQKYSNSSSGVCTGGGGGGGGVARSLKKLKQKKVPQRGLGVAQLEKIRLEEQQKRDAIFQVPSDSSSCLASQCSNFRPDVSSYLTSTSLIDHPLTNKTNGLPPLIPNRTDIVRSNSVSINGSECEMGWQDATSAGRGSCWSKLWNDEYNLQGDINFKLDHHGSNALRSSVNLFSETKNPMWPLPSREACPSSMVNVSIGTSSSSSSSSVMNFQTEPPSNQRYRSNKSTLLWPAEERIAGLKRTCPFSIDDAPVPSFNCKFPPTYASHIPRTDESAAFSSDGTFDFVQAHPVLIEGPSDSSRKSEHKKKNMVKENGGFNNHFLTLAPPVPKDSPSYLDPCIPEFPDFDALPYQGAPDDPIRLPGLIPSVEQPFFSFLPSAQQNGRSTVTKSNSNDVVENVDLSLKL